MLLSGLVCRTLEHSHIENSRLRTFSEAVELCFGFIDIVGSFLLGHLFRRGFGNLTHLGQVYFIARLYLVLHHDLAFNVRRWGKERRVGHFEAGSWKLMLVSCKDALIFGLCQFGTVLAFPTILQGTFGG